MLLDFLLPILPDFESSNKDPLHISTLPPTLFSQSFNSLTSPHTHFLSLTHALTHSSSLFPSLSSLFVIENHRHALDAAR